MSDAVFASPEGAKQSREHGLSAKQLARFVQTDFAKGEPRRSSDLLAMTTQIRIGKIAYTNTLPFYYGLSDVVENAVIRGGYPTQINEWIRSGEVDLAPISSLEYAVHPNDYYLLPEPCIASHHYSGSVLLFSKFPIGELDGKKIAVSEESLSSQVLLRILLSEVCGFQNSFVVTTSNPSEMLKMSDACLVIGDSALFHRLDRFCYKYDLAYLWNEWRKKPFCFSVWAVRREFFNQNPDDVYAFSEKLKQTTTQNLANIKELVMGAIGLSPYDEKFAVIFSYLSQLVYSFSQDVKDGLLEFYSFAEKAKIISEVPSLEFVPEKS